MEYRQVLIPFGVKNANGRIYLKESFKSIPESIPVTLFPLKDKDIPEDEIVGTAKITANEKMMLADIKIEKNIELAQTLLDSGYSFVTTSIGEYEEDGITIKNAETYEIHLAANPSWTKKYLDSLLEKADDNNKEPEKREAETSVASQG